MHKGRIGELIQSMEPSEAASEMAEAAKELFSHLGEEALRVFLEKLIEGGTEDKTAGMVHL